MPESAASASAASSRANPRRPSRAPLTPLFLEAVRYVLEKNILCGDALTLKDANGDPITFAEWSVVTGDKVKRRDYLLSELLEGHNAQPSLFGESGSMVTDWEYDEETKAYIPSAVREYPPINYWEVQRNG